MGAADIVCAARLAHHNNRPGRRLPIAEATAAVITAQKDWASERYPRTPPGKLALFPRDKGNKDGVGQVAVP